MGLELSNEQKEALEVAVARYKQGEKYTCIAGYAGTGKSTIVKVIIEALEVKNEDVCYCAFTGKAAEVLRRKGCPNACTAHKLLYNATKTEEGKFIFIPRDTLEKTYKIIVVDEISMLSVDLWNLLVKHPVYILALGDPFQIPPISKDADNHILDNPHAFLKTIFRQAEDSEIITLSMKIRNYLPIEYGKNKETHVAHTNEVVTGMYTWADQIIVGTNKKRREINDTLRKMNGLSGPPKVGDKIISLENHWSISDNTGSSALVNGTIGYIKSIKEINRKYRISRGFVIGPIPMYQITMENEIGQVFEDIYIDKKYILTGEKTLSSQQEYYIYKNRWRDGVGEPPCLFDYGYAITCHRAQGSEWDKVLIMEEKFPYDKEEHARWVYTGVTRGSEKIVLVR